MPSPRSFVYFANDAVIGPSLVFEQEWGVFGLGVSEKDVAPP